MEHYPGSGIFGCYVDNGRNWDHCGRTLRGPEQVVIGKHRTRTGDYCVSACERAGHAYSWCMTAGGDWDYCSINPGLDVNGRRCADRCDFHGESYTWCTLEVGGWDYCGTVEVDSETEYTYLGTKCVTPCKVKNNSTDNMCFDASRNERACSRMHGVATNDKECVGTCGHSEFGGKTEHYNWCWTDSRKTEWNYCSAIADDPRENIRSTPDWWHRRVDFPKEEIRLQLTRSRSLDNVFRFRDEQGNNQITFFEKLARLGASRQYSIRNDEEMLGWFTKCMANWAATNSSISSERGNVRLTEAGTRLKGVRLEQQRYTDYNGAEYVNLQMQVSGLARRQLGGRSGTIAEVQVPIHVVENNPQEVVTAMTLSLHEGYAVHIGRFNYEYEGNRRTPRNR